MGKNYKAETNNIIALCHILDDFEEFNKRLIPVISSKYNRNFVFKLWDISKGKFRFGARKAKKFYKENKSVIDTINKYTDITRFINTNYDWQGNPYDNSGLQFFYEYISSNRENIDKILEVLEKIKELGFDGFEFNENLDFTTESYDVYPDFRRNYFITYVDNIVVPPSYVSHIDYGTTFSNYKMKLDFTGGRISKYCSSITLNSLLFDSKRLPKKLDKENIFDSILALKNLQEDKSANIRNSVDLSISVYDLAYRLGITTNIINRLDGVENKEQLIETLTRIKTDVEKLQTLSEEYDSSVSEKEPSITPEVLEIEKQLYIKRRDWASMDID